MRGQCHVACPRITPRRPVTKRMPYPEGIVGGIHSGHYRLPLLFGGSRVVEMDEGGLPEEYAKFLAVAVPWGISGTGASHLLVSLTS